LEKCSTELEEVPTIEDAIENMGRGVWDALQPHEKYGTFHKLGNNGVVSTLSEEISYAHIGKYNNFLFG
jgi:hypothetical protein